MCFAVCMSYLSECVHNLVMHFAVCIWAYGQNTINHLKSQVSLFKLEREVPKLYHYYIVLPENKCWAQWLHDSLSSAIIDQLRVADRQEGIAAAREPCAGLQPAPTAESLMPPPAALYRSRPCLCRVLVPSGCHARCTSQNGGRLTAFIH